MNRKGTLFWKSETPIFYFFVYDCRLTGVNYIVKNQMKCRSRSLHQDQNSRHRQKNAEFLQVLPILYRGGAITLAAAELPLILV